MTPLDFYQYLIRKGFEERKSQRDMISIVDKVLQKGGVKLVEAPTGTGKTFAYLIPIIVRQQKAIISTGTKILQDQLKRDIEFLSSHWKILTGKKISYAVIKGKGNYLCLDRFFKEEIEAEDRLEIETLIETEWDGDLTLTGISMESLTKINVDEDYCTYAYRQTCPYFSQCYYWSRVKRREASADILVINHSLLALIDFDTKGRILIIDEAHELDRYLTLATTFGISLYWFKDVQKGLEKLLGESVYLPAEEFFIKNFEKLFSEEDREKPLEDLKEYIPQMRELLYEPLRISVNKLREKIKKEVRDFAENRLMVSFTFKDYIANTLLFEEEFIENLNAGYEEPTAEERDLIDLIKKLDFYKRKLNKLKAFIGLADREEEGIGFQISRNWSKKLNGYNYRLEAFYIFPQGIIEPEDYKGVVLTSATIEPEDIYLTTGIAGEYHKLEHNYDYTRSTVIIENTNPKREDWKEKLLTSYYILRSQYDRVLVLLTNREHLKLFEEEEVGIQGKDSLTKLIEYLRKGHIKVLVGLDSLWTGVDIKGDKGILMSKLPFENPNDPLTYHRIKFLKEQGEDPFLYQRRKAYIKFRQGIGRLVRQKSDRGTIVICDNRIWRYREFIDFLNSIGIRIIPKGKFTKSGYRYPFW